MPDTPTRHAYLRVSTVDQNVHRQLHGLKAHSDTVHVEHASAVAHSRPVFNQLLHDLRRGDSLVVWDLDRAFRSTKEAILTADALRERGIGFHIITMQIDTNTPEGELFYTMLAGFAQYERRMIARRTREGMAAAKNRGKTFGRPYLLSEDITRQAHAWMQETQYSARYVAALLGVSRMTLQRAFKRYDLTREAA